MTITNPSFEDQGIQSGWADGWSIKDSTFYSFAGFDSAGDWEPVEDFEEFWASNDVFERSWEDVTDEQAQFDPADPQPFEDFEEEWSDNHNFVTGLTPGNTAAAAFDPHGDERFEAKWSSNSTFEHDWGDVTPEDALFDSGVQDVEDFWLGWNNDTFRYNWGPPYDRAYFQTQDTEHFEESVWWVPIPVIITPGYGDAVPIDKTHRVRVEVTLTGPPDTFEIVVQGLYESTWRNYGTFTDAGTVDLPTGLSAVRVETVSYTGPGLPGARYHWGRMETL